MKAPVSLRLAAGFLGGQASRTWLSVFCVALGVAACTGVGAFLASLDASLARESRLLLGADIEVSGREPLSKARVGELLKLLPAGSRISERVSLLTMASTLPGNPGGRRTRLVQLGSVDRAYPLAGRLEVDAAQGSPDASNLQRGARLFAQRELCVELGLGVGGKLRLGSRVFTLAGILVDEPGLGASAFSLGPRVLIGAGEAAAAGLTGFGSNVSYETLVALPDASQTESVASQVRRHWGISKLPYAHGQPPPSGTLSLRTPKDAQDDLRRFFDRLADYLGLVSLAALLLGGVGVAGVMRGFVREAAVPSGILRAVGATPAMLRAVFAWQVLALGALGGVLGAALGWGGQVLLASALGDFLPVVLRASFSLRPVAWGLFLGLLTALAFGMEPVLAAGGRSAAALLRDEDPPLPPRWRRVCGLPLRPPWDAALVWRLVCGLIFAGVAALQAHSWLRGPGSFAALALGAWSLRSMGARLLPRLAALRGSSLLPRGRPGFALRHALANLGRPGLRAGAGVVALGCAALLLGVLAVYQHSLLAELDPARERGRMPDLFMIDVQKTQVNPLKALAVSVAPGTRLQMSPMVKARYRGKLGEPDPAGSPAAHAATREQEDSRALRDREQNLSWRDQLGPDESLAQGTWMDPRGRDVEASLEQGYAERLGVGLGDVLRFDVQGVEVQARVSSLRKVDWAGFQPNFFVLLSPWALRDAPQTWIASAAHVGGPARIQALQSAVVDRFPNVTLFEVAHVAAKILAILDKIAAAVRLVALGSLATGLMVLAGLALATARTRRAEAALLKVLGASQGQILAATAWEFGLLAALAAALGLGLSLLFGWVLLVKVFELEYGVPWLQLAALALLFTATGTLTGLAASWQVYRAAPAEVLREP
jgi:putative ABC transport system permease protein